MIVKMWVITDKDGKYYDGWDGWYERTDRHLPYFYSKKAFAEASLLDLQVRFEERLPKIDEITVNWTDL